MASANNTFTKAFTISTVAGNPRIGIGNDFTSAMPAFSLSFDKNVAHTIGVATTVNTVVGRALTISAGSTSTGGTADLAGGNLILNAGLGKGTGTSDIIFSTGRTLTTGSTLHTLTECARFTGDGYLGIGTTTPDNFLTIKNITAGVSNMLSIASQ